MLNEAESPRIKISPKERELLTGMEKALYSLLNDYSDDVPEELVEDRPSTHKCQNNWFMMAYGRLSVLKVSIRNGLNMCSLLKVLNEALRFFERYALLSKLVRMKGDRNLATSQHIENANKVIGRVIEEIDSILSESGA
jgi:hypothetical protein